MKRYTSFTDDYPVVTSDHCWEDQNEDYCGPAIERLAEYEATGLMPAEVAALQYQLRHARGGQRWIPVTERMPEKNNQWVLCLCVSGAMEVLKFDYTMWNWDSQYPRRCYMESYVAHWMPLPEPPKEVE
jgi:hypothetical protein